MSDLKHNEPTLGWLSVSDDGNGQPGRILGVWQARMTLVDGGPLGSWSHEYVTGFEHATAVPTRALNELIRASE